MARAIGAAPAAGYPRGGKMKDFQGQNGIWDMVIIQQSEERG